jgi:hypothetical protein
MKLSIVINCDSRPGINDQYSVADQMFDGCRSGDFLTEGVWNKIKFFEGFNIELILYIDEHLEIPVESMQYLKPLCTTLVIRKHTDENSFNDWNYLRALSLASGDVIIHLDQDTAAFTSGQDYVKKLISHLDNYKLVSYPSYWSPHPVNDESFGGIFWASTRFFMCKREDLKLDEIAKYIVEPELMYEKYGDSPRRCNWFEHFLAKVNGNDVYYPPIELSEGTVFSWKTYKAGILKELNDKTYTEVQEFINQKGGIIYPNDIVV